MTFTWIRNIEKSSYPDWKCPLIVRDERKAHNTITVCLWKCVIFPKPSLCLWNQLDLFQERRPRVCLSCLTVVCCIELFSRFLDVIGLAELPSLYQIARSASFCLSPSLHERQQRLLPFGVHLKGMYNSCRFRTTLTWTKNKTKKNVERSSCHDHRLVGLVVRRPPRKRKIPGSNPACAGISPWVESYQWLQNWHSSGYPARRLAL